jgi:CRP-like cAMP-binding protein
MKTDPSIEEQLLLEYGAKRKDYPQGSTIFSEGDAARYYWQIQAGEVKMNNFNEEGKEFIQGIFSEGESFGEPPLLVSKSYPANAVALTDVTLLQLPQAVFLTLLYEHPETSIALNKRLSNRLYYKSVMASEISSQDAEHRLLKLIDYLKYHVEGLKENETYCVQLTRQQLADLTGLRVETVIRSIKLLEKKGALSIKDRKIFR